MGIETKANSNGCMLSQLHYDVQQMKEELTEQIQQLQAQIQAIRKSKEDNKKSFDETKMIMQRETDGLRVELQQSAGRYGSRMFYLTVSDKNHTRVELVT